MFKQMRIYTTSFNAFDLGFSFVQPDLGKSTNLEFTYAMDKPSQLFYHFSASSCDPKEFGKEEAHQCNQIFPNAGSYEIQIKSLPAVASFKLWKKKPAADSNSDINFTVNFENGF